MGRYYCEGKKIDVNISDICQNCSFATEERENGYFRGCLFLFDKVENKSVMQPMSKTTMIENLKEIVECYVQENGVKDMSLIINIKNGEAEVNGK